MPYLLKLLLQHGRKGSHQATCLAPDDCCPTPLRRGPQSCPPCRFDCWPATSGHVRASIGRSDIGRGTNLHVVIREAHAMCECHRTLPPARRLILSFPEGQRTRPAVVINESRGGGAAAEGTRRRRRRGALRRGLTAAPRRVRTGSRAARTPARVAGGAAATPLRALAARAARRASR